MYDVRDITNFTLDYADKRGIKITNLALQKLLYFVHGWFYSIFDAPLIKNKFEAWKYGPVQRVIYDQFKHYRDRPIVDIRATFIDPETGEQLYRQPNLISEHADLIAGVLERYSRYTAGQLVDASHVEDGPWEYVWKSANEDDVIFPGMKIPDLLILEHFKRLPPILTLH